MKCWNCQKEENIPDKPGRLDTCSYCQSFLHSCLNCKFYDKNANHECREPQAEWVRDKKMANFCGYFTPSGNNAEVRTETKKLLSKEEAEKKWTKLFKKK